MNEMNILLIAGSIIGALIVIKVLFGKKSGHKVINQLLSRGELKVYLSGQNKDELRYFYNDAHFIKDLFAIFKDKATAVNLSVNKKPSSAECSIEFITNELISDVMKSHEKIAEEIQVFVESKKSAGEKVFILTEFDDAGKVIKSKLSYTVPVM